MAPQLAAAVDDYSITVISSGGFESVTEKHRFAKMLAEVDGKAEVLHIGDHDPSGAHLFLALAEDVTAFAEGYGGRVTFTRLAVTPDQIDELRLPTAPAKSTDARAFEGETCQAEAIPPDVLNELLIAAIEQRTNADIRAEVLEREETAREELCALLAAR